jgi:TetR/AcrR family transcriptional regulator, transcriptional repressor of aconitase
MSKTMSKPRKRLTRGGSRAQTRATLMAVGRKHFIRHGLGGAVAEKIAEDAGYSRGALYSNFDGKEELFLAVIREEQERRTEAPYSLFKEEPSAKERLRKWRDAIADIVTDPDWIVLRAEFEAGALRNVFGRLLLKCIISRSAMEETLSGISHDLPISIWA